MSEAPAYRHVPLSRVPALILEAWRMTQWRFDFVVLFLLNYGASLAVGALSGGRIPALATELAGVALIPGLWLICHEFAEERRVRLRRNFALFLEPSLALKLSGWLLAMAAVELGAEALSGGNLPAQRRGGITLVQMFLFQVIAGLALPLQLFRGLGFPSAMGGALRLLRSWPAIAAVALGQLVGLLVATLPAMLLPALFHPALFEAGAKGIDWTANVPMFLLVLLLIPLPALVAAGPTLITGYLLFRELAPPKQIE